MLRSDTQSGRSRTSNFDLFPLAARSAALSCGAGPCRERGSRAARDRGRDEPRGPDGRSAFHLGAPLHPPRATHSAPPRGGLCAARGADRSSRTSPARVTPAGWARMFRGLAAANAFSASSNLGWICRAQPHREPRRICTSSARSPA